MTTFNVGDQVRISTDVDLTDMPELTYALGRFGVVTDTDNFGVPDSPLTMYDVAIKDAGTTVAFYGNELTLVQAVTSS